MREENASRGAETIIKNDCSFYTKDIFQCSLCESSLASLDEYVSHMIVTEKCVFVMEPSSIISELMLPRFIPPESDAKKNTENSEQQVSQLRAFPQNKKATTSTFKEELDELQKTPTKTFKDSKNFPLYPMCPVCGQLFKSVKSMKTHEKNVHSGKTSFVCEEKLCGMSFSTLSSLNRHRKRHEDIRPFECSLCHRKFREPGSLTRHQKTNCQQKSSVSSRYGVTMPFTSPPKQMLPPSDLKKEEPSMPLLFNDANSSQTETKDGEENKPDVDVKNIIRTCFTCPLCMTQYETNEKLVKHMKCHYDEMEQKCSVCEKSFNCPSSLARHWTTHSAAKQFECGICEKKFKLRTHVITHLKTHSEEKSFTCPECGNSFKTASSLNVHLKTHSNEKPFQCELCSKCFGVKSSLIRHLRVHTGDRPFSCPNCSQGFKEQGTLARHLRSKNQCLNLSTKHETESVLSSDMADTISILSDKTDSIMDFEEFMLPDASHMDNQEELYILSEAML